MVPPLPTEAEPCVGALAPTPHLAVHPKISSEFFFNFGNANFVVVSTFRRLPKPSENRRFFATEGSKKSKKIAIWKKNLLILTFWRRILQKSGSENPCSKFEIGL